MGNPRIRRLCAVNFAAIGGGIAQGEFTSPEHVKSKGPAGTGAGGTDCPPAAQEKAIAAAKAMEEE